jgi:hypothetical protein
MKRLKFFAWSILLALAWLDHHLWLRSTPSPINCTCPRWWEWEAFWSVSAFSSRL